MEIQPPSCWLILVSVSEACWRVVEESNKPPRFGRVIVITIVTFVPGRVSEGGLRLQMLKVFVSAEFRLGAVNRKWMDTRLSLVCNVNSLG